jgi:LacI family transcriptional regulator
MLSLYTTSIFSDIFTVMTVREVAELAGVSIGTVDRVLYHRGRVSLATKAKVKEIIERYQFTPNPIARRLKRNKAYRFCALIPQREQDAGYWGQALQGIQDCADTLTPMGIETEIIEYDRYNIESFNNAAGTVLAHKPDGVIFPPVMPDKTKFFLDEMQWQRIPYIFFDADFPGTAPLTVIGHDSFKGGYLAGRLMHLFTGNATKPLAVLDAHGEDYHVTRRRDGFLKYAAEHGFTTVSMEYSGYQGVELPEEEVSRFLRESPALAGVFITNCMAHRVAEAAELNSLKRDFCIVGYDLIPKNRRLLAEGRIDAIISQHPDEQGREALSALYRYILLEQKIAARIEIPMDICIKENILE